MGDPPHPANGAPACPWQEFRDDVVSRLELVLSQNQQNIHKLPLPNDAREIEKSLYLRYEDKDEYARAISKVILAIKCNTAESAITVNGLASVPGHPAECRPLQADVDLFVQKVGAFLRQLPADRFQEARAQMDQLMAAFGASEK